MTATIAIVDYCKGNLASVQRGLADAGFDARITDVPADILAADGVVLPGVGAFTDAMTTMEETGQADALRTAVADGGRFLGICLGMQIAVIEYARHVAGWADAHSAEFSGLTAHPVIALMPDQNGVEDIGGTLRLGAYPCVLDKDSRAYQLYGQENISERHRHRYEVNNDYRAVLTEHGLRLSGLSPDGRIVEMCELTEHPFFVATQGHPELKSRPNRPHPLFKGFVEAALENKHRK